MVPKSPSQPLQTDGWVRSLAVVAFDVGTGHKLEAMWPPDSLSLEDQGRIRMLAMPDCNTTQIGDSFYCFRTRRSFGLPLFSSALLNQSFEYCYCLFRQEKNTECARGFFQKSVVLVSRYPYVNLFERLVKVIGPLYFEHGQAVLEAVLAHIEEWPAPHPNSPVVLPFLGEAIYFSVPDIAMPPQIAAKYAYHCGEALCDTWLRRRRELRNQSRASSVCGGSEVGEEVCPPLQPFSANVIVQAGVRAVTGASQGGGDSGSPAMAAAAAGCGAERPSPLAPAATGATPAAAVAGISPMTVLRTLAPPGITVGFEPPARSRTWDSGSGGGESASPPPWADQNHTPLASLSSASGRAPLDPGLRMRLAGGTPGSPLSPTGRYRAMGAMGVGNGMGTSSLGPRGTLLWGQTPVAAEPGSHLLSSVAGLGRVDSAGRLMTRSGSADQAGMRPPVHSDADFLPPLAALDTLTSHTSMAGGCYFSSGSSSDDEESGDELDSGDRGDGRGTSGSQRRYSVRETGGRHSREGSAGGMGGLTTQRRGTVKLESDISRMSEAAAAAAAVVAATGRAEEGEVTRQGRASSKVASGGALLGDTAPLDKPGRAATTGGLNDGTAEREKDGGGGVLGVLNRSRTDSELSEVLRMHDNARKLPSGRSPFAEMLLADEARFRVKQGLFQSIGLYSIFGVKLVEHLWSMWELVLCGSPALVVAPNVGSSSAVILGMVSLASPVYYGGDFRPHFTTFDPDYGDIVKMHDEVSRAEEESPTANGARFAAVMLGVINPIFLKMLPKWPNAIVLPGAAGRTPTDWRKLQRMIGGGRGGGGGGSGGGSHKHKSRTANAQDARHTESCKVHVVRGSASLDSIVMDGAAAEHDEPMVVMRRQPVMRPDARVLRQLLDPHKLVGHSADATETKRQWKDSIRAINDIILRRHFTALTRAFLEPFDPYFRLDTSWSEASPPPGMLSRSGSLSPRPQSAANSVSAAAVAAADPAADPADPGLQPATLPVQMQWSRRLGSNNVQLTIYSDPEKLLLRFDEEEFMARLQLQGPPVPFQGVRWQVLYRRFINSPNFRPWFTTQRIACVEELREVCREVCMRTHGEELLRSHMAVGSDHLGQKDLLHLLFSVRGALAREGARREQDEELQRQMRLHLAVIDEALLRAETGPANGGGGSGGNQECCGAGAGEAEGGSDGFRGTAVSREEEDGGGAGGVLPVLNRDGRGGRTRGGV